MIQFLTRVFLSNLFFPTWIIWFFSSWFFFQQNKFHLFPCVRKTFLSFNYRKVSPYAWNRYLYFVYVCVVLKCENNRMLLHMKILKNMNFSKAYIIRMSIKYNVIIQINSHEDDLCFTWTSYYFMKVKDNKWKDDINYLSHL